MLRGFTNVPPTYNSDFVGVDGEDALKMVSSSAPQRLALDDVHKGRRLSRAAAYYIVVYGRCKVFEPPAQNAAVLSNVYSYMLLHAREAKMTFKIVSSDLFGIDSIAKDQEIKENNVLQK